ncbi:MAG TPA: class I SAM-dependent RNA methyltransferase [Dongiaceae bacterium]|nr:class I SAM-dependent RNA methyltransferase [Dongiaceae bacterium]
MGGSIEVMIEALGQQGDGLASWQNEQLFVPFALPGERVQAVLAGRQNSSLRARVQQILEPAADRVAPACRHFGICGGCALQHLAGDSYRRWKAGTVVTTLAQRGIALDFTPTEVFVPAGTRRRAVFAVIGVKGGIAVGFHRAASHEIVDLQQCALLTPALFALVPALRDTLRTALATGESWDVLATQCLNGIDILVTAKAAPTNAQRFALADLAQIELPSGDGARIGVARVTWLIDKRGAAPEPIAQHHLPQVSFADVRVDLPAQSFLQPSAEGEAALRDAVLAGVGEASLVADLYAGCGTFSFPLAARGRVIAVEGVKASVAALNQAARRALVSARVTATSQDLDDAPLMAEQLKKVQAVVFDPPRAGARSQCEQIARSTISRAVGVSCNPATFARDARILIDGGFHLTALTIVDQFIWSPHVELVAAFQR